MGARKRAHPGFTLIEMLVAVTVLGLMLMATMPSATAWIRNLRLRTLSESMLGGLQQARAEAVRRNTLVTFWLVNQSNPTVMDNSCTLSSSGQAWVVSLDSPAGKCGSAVSTSTSPRIVAMQGAAQGTASSLRVRAYQIDGTTAASAITFNGFGRTTTRITGNNPVALIKVDYASSSDGDRPLWILISPSGSVTLCDPNSAIPSTDPRYCPSLSSI